MRATVPYATTGSTISFCFGDAKANLNGKQSPPHPIWQTKSHFPMDHAQEHDQNPAPARESPPCASTIQPGPPPTPRVPLTPPIPAEENNSTDQSPRKKEGTNRRKKKTKRRPHARSPPGSRVPRRPTRIQPPPNPTRPPCVSADLVGSRALTSGLGAGHASPSPLAWLGLASASALGRLA